VNDENTRRYGERDSLDSYRGYRWNRVGTLVSMVVWIGHDDEYGVSKGFWFVIAAIMIIYLGALIVL